MGKRLNTCTLFVCAVALGTIAVSQGDIHADTTAAETISENQSISANAVAASTPSANTSSETAPATNNGQDISDNITSISTSSSDGSEPRDGSYMNIRVEFDEHQHKIHNNDQITVNWPTTGNVYGMGAQKNLNLTINGQNEDGQDVSFENGAVLNVKNNQAVITFTHPALDTLKNVKGWASFEVQVRNDGNGGTFHVNGGNSSVDINFKPVDRTPSTPQEDDRFYYKTGDILPSMTDRVRWFLNINIHNRYADGPVFVKDQIQAGQELDTDSFDITVNNRSHYYGKNAIQDFQKAYDGATIETNNNTILVNIPGKWVSCNYFVIHYLTKITNESQESFSNFSTISYHEHGKNPVTDFSSRDTNHSVHNILVDGGVSGDKDKQKPADKTDNPKESIPWTPLTPAKKTTWTELKPSTKPVNPVIPHDDSKIEVIIPDKKTDQPGEKQKSDENIPWTPLSPAKKTTPWTPLTPAKKTAPWTPLTPARKTTPWTPLTPAKKTTPWTPLTPAKKTAPWTPLTPAKKATPSIPLSPAQEEPQEATEVPTPVKKNDVPVVENESAVIETTPQALVTTNVKLITPQKSASVVSPVSTSNDQQTLPQTGNSNHALLSLLLTLPLTFGLLFKKKSTK